jgi:hypothetical protein
VLPALLEVRLQQHLVAAPRQLGHTGHDAAVQLADAVVEQLALLAVQRGDDLQGGRGRCTGWVCELLRVLCVDILGLGL